VGGLDETIPLSALQHAVYCLRQAALIHIERLREESRFTAEGRVLHEVAHEPGLRRQKGLRRVTAQPLTSKRLNLSGVADPVEFRSGRMVKSPTQSNTSAARPSCIAPTRYNSVPRRCAWRK
jgi:CRISPR-associated exonuclease Cas4